MLLLNVRLIMEFTKSPVIVFGGSYGGMLSAWTRMKYPNVIAGALAASAPIWQFPGLTPCDSFARGVTHDFLRADSSGKCQKSIRRSWGEIDKMGKKVNSRTRQRLNVILVGIMPRACTLCGISAAIAWLAC
jgi:pimeloyl-ACP methyl ester carboxylesterase